MPTSTALPESDFSEITRDDGAAVFASYPAPLRERLLELRQLILDTAAITEGVGDVEEALRWSAPSYLTAESKSGSTIRIDAHDGADDRYALYFNRQTTLVGTFQMYPDLF